SHLRRLVAAATPETEAAWLARAQAETVRGLDAALASACGTPPDPDEAAIDGEPRTRFHLRCPRRVRRLWPHAAALPRRMSGAAADRLPDRTPSASGRRAPAPPGVRLPVAARLRARAPRLLAPQDARPRRSRPPPGRAADACGGLPRRPALICPCARAAARDQ